MAVMFSIVLEADEKGNVGWGEMIYSHDKDYIGWMMYSTYLPVLHLMKAN